MQEVDDDEGFIDTSHNDVYFGVQIINEIIPPNSEGVGGLYLGRVHMVKRVEQLKQMKIGAILSVINTPVEIDPKECITHKYIKIEDDSDSDLAKHFEESIEFISENLKKTNVYVHCQMGISRSSTLVIAFMMKQNKETFENTLNYVKSKRDCVNPNEGFKQQLRAFEKDLFKE